MWRIILQTILDELAWTAHTLKCGNRWSRLLQHSDGRLYIECNICGMQWMEDRRER